MTPKVNRNNQLGWFILLLEMQWVSFELPEM